MTRLNFKCDLIVNASFFEFNKKDAIKQLDAVQSLVFQEVVNFDPHFLHFHFPEVFFEKLSVGLSMLMEQEVDIADVLFVVCLSWQSTH